MFGSFFVLAQGAKQFNILVCPSCKYQWSEPKVRIFGVVPQEWAWVPAAVFWLLVLSFVAWNATAT